jgi:hypothetical protein
MSLAFRLTDPRFGLNRNRYGCRGPRKTATGAAEVNRALIASRQCPRRGAFRIQVRLSAESRHREGCEVWLRGVMSQTCEYPQCDLRTASSSGRLFGPRAMHWADMRFFALCASALHSNAEKKCRPPNIPAKTTNLIEKNVIER